MWITSKSFYRFFPNKFKVNLDHATRCTKCWSNLTLKCYAYTFVKAQLEEECRQTIFFFKGHSYPKLYCIKMNTNQKPTANTVSSTKRKTLCWMRGEIKNFCLSKLLCICPFFSKKISIKKQSIASTEISLLFLAPKVPVFRKNKAAISSTSSYPFFSCNEKPCTW